MVITDAGTAYEDEVSTKSQDNEAELTGERVWWGGKQRQPAWGLQMAEELNSKQAPRELLVVAWLGVMTVATSHRMGSLPCSHFHGGLGCRGYGHERAACERG